MRIKFDERNKAVIAEGHCRHKVVRCVAVCSNEDTFDKEFGQKLATKKYKAKETAIKIQSHRSTISDIKDMIARQLAIIDNEQQIIDALNVKFENQQEDIADFIKAKYNG